MATISLSVMAFVISTHPVFDEQLVTPTTQVMVTSSDQSAIQDQQLQWTTGFKLAVAPDDLSGSGTVSLVLNFITPPANSTDISYAISE